MHKVSGQYGRAQITRLQNNNVTIYELDKIGIIKLNTMTSLRLTAIESHHCVTCVNSLCNLCT